MSKTLFAFGLAVLLSIGLCSCQGQKNNAAKNSEMYVVTDAYNLTPQEYIDRVNEIVESTGDSRYKTIPDFEKSGSVIYVSLPISVTIDTNDAGFITRIKFDWKSTSSATQTAATFLVGTTICMLSVDNADAIIEQLDMTATGVSSYETTCTMDGSTYDYFVFGDGKYNWLTITPTVAE